MIKNIAEQIAIAIQLVEKDLMGEKAEVFDEQDVPAEVTPLIPLAKCLGVADDWDRTRRAARLSEGAKSMLKSILKAFEDELDEWLAGNESAGPKFSDAYIAFSAMRMTFD